jgi:hypothetical protein
LNTGIKSSVVSNASGVYLFAALAPGEYRFSAEKEGFKRLDLNATTVRVGDRLQQNLQLQLGGTAEVAANTDSVNYLSASPGGERNTQRIQDLPVSGRNVMELVETQPGLVLTSSGANINAARTHYVNVTLDGVNVMDSAVLTSATGQSISTTVDRIEVVKVITSPVDAEYGRGSGQVVLISRSGTNRFYVSAYDFAHNTDLNANTWSNNRSAIPRSVLVENQTGARVDGPIRKNLTGDGLNTAGYVWQQHGINDLYSLDFRADHNFNQSERLTFSYNRNYNNAPNGNDAQVFPTSPVGQTGFPYMPQNASLAGLALLT